MTEEPTKASDKAKADRLLKHTTAAELIYIARTEASMTQMDLAAALYHSDNSTVSKWEAGKAEPRVGTLLKIMAACGVDVEVKTTTKARGLTLDDAITMVADASRHKID